MNVPNKHKALAHAWVDGAEIEHKTYDGKWSRIINPSWLNNEEYRIKPKKVRFWQNHQGTCFPTFNEKNDIETYHNFDKWLTDWVDYVG